MPANKYTLLLDEKEIRLLLNALGKRPFEEVYELIEKIVTCTTISPEQSRAPKTAPKKK